MKKVTLVIVTPCTISIFCVFLLKDIYSKNFEYFTGCARKNWKLLSKNHRQRKQRNEKKSQHPLCLELKKAPGRNPSFFGMVYITVYENLQKCLIFEFPFELLFKYFNFFSQQKWCKMRLFEWFSNTVLSYISNATFLRPV